MEYAIFNFFRHIPRWVRFVAGVIFLILGTLFLLVPVFPGIPLLIIGFLFMVSAKKIKKVVKIRKGLQHLAQNFSWKKLKHKWFDIKTHIKHILFRNK